MKSVLAAALPAAVAGDEDANPLILRSRTLRPGTDPQMLSRYRDDVWQLTAAHPDLHVSLPCLRWGRFPPGMAEVFKPFFLAALDHPYPVGPGHTRPNTRPSVGTFNYWYLDSLALAAWMHSREIDTLAHLTEPDLDTYKHHVLGLDRSAGRKVDMLALVRTIWLYRDHLPPHARVNTGYPWGPVIASRLVPQPAPGPDNKTPRIASDTMDALLAWALRVTEDLAADILAADAEYQKLEAGTHPSQQIYAGLATALRLDVFLRQARKSGVCLPEHPHRPGKVNQAHLLRLMGVPDDKRGGMSRCQKRRLETCGLPLGRDDQLGPIRAYIGGRPWREGGITVDEIPTLKRVLSAACFIVICYLSGMRPGEVLNLRRGCRDTDPVTGELLLVGRPGKGYDRTPAGPHDSSGSNGSLPSRPWTVVAPVHTAVDVLERLHPHDLLFPAAVVLSRTDRPNQQYARQAGSLTQDLDHFVSWVNTTFPAEDGRSAIPPDPAKHIHASRFRRTLAYFIVRRPRGLIAAALQYGHVQTRVTLGYAGRADTSWIDDVAVERLEMVLEQTEKDHYLLEAGEHVSGPAAEEFRSCVAVSARFAGRVVMTRRNIGRLLSQADPSIHHGEAMTCVWRPETAACRLARIEQGLPVNDTPEEHECRSHCANLAFTDRDIGQATLVLQQFEQQAADPLAPLPRRDRATAQAGQLRAVIARHEQTRPSPGLEEGASR